VLLQLLLHATHHVTMRAQSLASGLLGFGAPTELAFDSGVLGVRRSCLLAGPGELETRLLQPHLEVAALGRRALTPLRCILEALRRHREIALKLAESKTSGPEIFDHSGAVTLGGVARLGGDFAGSLCSEQPIAILRKDVGQFGVAPLETCRIRCELIKALPCQGQRHGKLLFRQGDVPLGLALLAGERANL
jgi:hypothetical protein